MDYRIKSCNDARGVADGSEHLAPYIARTTGVIPALCGDPIHIAVGRTGVSGLELTRLLCFARCASGTSGSPHKAGMTAEDVAGPCPYR